MTVASHTPSPRSHGTPTHERIEQDGDKAPFVETNVSEATYEDALSVDLEGVYFGCQAAAEVMKVVLRTSPALAAYTTGVTGDVQTQAPSTTP